jgi:phage gpG-like protein
MGGFEVKIFTMASFGEHLAKMATTVVLGERQGLKKAAELVEKEAKSEFGTYQGAIGHFEKWAELENSTKDDRVASGFTENDPLLRSGSLRDTVSHEVSGLEAVIGSASDIMVYQELGTATIPPRAVLGPSLLRKEKEVLKILGVHTATAMLAGSAFSHMPTIKED